MTITEKGSCLVAALEGDTLTEKDRAELLKLTNEDWEDELLELMDEADKIARPVALFAVCGVDENAAVNIREVGRRMLKQQEESCA